MKNVKKVMPFMAFVMAVGLAFANQVNVQTGLWVERDGVAYELKSETCTSNTNDRCQVIFANDPTGTMHPVFTDQTLQTPKLGGTGGGAYIINE